MSAVPITLDSLTANNLGLFNRITAPVEYPDHYLQQCKDSGELCRYAYFSEVPVGLIVLQPLVNKSPVALHIALLSVLDAYANDFGVETKLVQYALGLCPKRHLSTCTAVARKTDTTRAALLTELGFHAEPDTAKDVYRGLSVAADETLFVKAI